MVVGTSTTGSKIIRFGTPQSTLKLLVGGGGQWKSTRVFINNSGAGTWVEGANYGLISGLNVSENQSIYIAFDGSDSGGNINTERGFMNLIQIVSVPAFTVPEPSVVAVLIGLLSGVGVILLRRSRS